MKLTIKKNSTGMQSPGMSKSYGYDVFIDDYKLGNGVTGIALNMVPNSVPQLIITADLNKIDIDIDAMIARDARKYWSDQEQDNE